MIRHLALLMLLLLPQLALLHDLALALLLCCPAPAARLGRIWRCLGASAQLLAGRACRSTPLHTDRFISRLLMVASLRCHAQYPVLTAM
jgi:hypothetical protein